MPEELFEKMKKSIKPQWSACFWSGLIIGLLAHLYKITNWLPNWDSLVFRYDAQNMVSLGRWFLPIVSAPSSYYDLPWLTGLLAIVFFSLGAVCICRIFDVKKTITAVLIGGVVVSFPTVTSVLLYNYVADAYAFSFLLACVAALLLTGSMWGDKKASGVAKQITAAVLIALSVGIYQAYITVTIMLLLCYLIMEVLYGNNSVKQLLLQAVRFLITGVVGMVLYYLIHTIVVKVTGTELLEYQGFDSALSFTGLDLAGSLYTIKETFLGYFFDFSRGISVFAMINLVMVIASVGFYLAYMVKKKLPVAKIVILCACGILLPIGASVLCLINSSMDYHNLMMMGFCMFYLFFLLPYEKVGERGPGQVKAWMILMVSVILIFNQIVIANVSYHKLSMAYEKSYGTLIRIADRMEQTEGAETCSQILVLGALEDSEAYSAILPPDITGTTDGVILRADDEVVGQSVFCSAINDYCGKNYQFLAGEEKLAFLEKMDVNSIPNWPAGESLFVMDQVIVIKLGD